MLPTIFPLASIAVNPFIFYHFSGFMGEREIIPECSICCSGREISRCCPLFQPEEAGPASASGSLRRAAFSPSRPAGLRAPARPCPAAAWRGARPLCTPPGGWRHVPAALTFSLGRVHLGEPGGSWPPLTLAGWLCSGDKMALLFDMCNFSVPCFSLKLPLMLGEVCIMILLLFFLNFARARP